MTMVRLSPKALRLAEYALASGSGTALFDGEREAVWRAWSRDHGTVGQTLLPTQSSYVDVPDHVGAVLLNAIENFLSRNAENTGEDADLGNDRMFLRSIESTLRLELGRDFDPVNA